MSEFQRQIFQKKLLEAEKALGFDYSENAEEEESEQLSEEKEQQDTISPLNNDAPFPPRKLPSLRPLRPHPAKDITPKEWFEFFSEKKVLEDDTGSKFTIYYTLPGSAESPLFVFHHGAGSSGLTFALLCKQIEAHICHDQEKDRINSNRSIKPGFLLFDARGHGLTITKGSNFSRESFSTDFQFIFRHYINSIDPLFHNVVGKKKENPSAQFPPVIFVGHSLGGAVLTETLHNGMLQDLTDANVIKGLVMFDIVEDTAVESLAHMNKFLSSRPRGFRDLKTAIDWHTKSNFLRNRESALVSVPALLEPVQPTDTDYLSFKYKWRSNLAATEPYWDTWFKGLSSGFVSAPVQAKLLVLAGNDSLDKNLMIGQMQGKFQLIVFLESGHFLHEDMPNKTAISLVDFWKRNFNKKQEKIPILWGHLRN